MIIKLIAFLGTIINCFIQRAYLACISHWAIYKINWVKTQRKFRAEKFGVLSAGRTVKFSAHYAPRPRPPQLVMYGKRKKELKADKDLFSFTVSCSLKYTNIALNYFYFCALERKVYVLLGLEGIFYDSVTHCWSSSALLKQQFETETQFINAPLLPLAATTIRWIKSLFCF